MKYTPITIILLALFVMPFAVAGNVNGFGSETFFGYEGQNSDFVTNWNPVNTQTFSVGMEDVPVVCNIDTSTPENELIVYSGTSVYLYSGKGNTLVELDSYSVGNGITSLACLGDKIHVGTTANYVQLEYTTELGQSGSSSVGAVHDISCSYDNVECAVLFDDGVFIFNNTGGSLFDAGFGYEDPSLSYVSGDKIQYVATDFVFIWDVSAETVVYFNTTQGASLPHSTRNINGDLVSAKPYFGDFSSDGSFEYCYRVVNQVSLDKQFNLYCYDRSDSLINSEIIFQGNPAGGFILRNTEVMKTGNNVEICSIYTAVTDAIRCYEPYSDSLTSLTSVNVLDNSEATYTQGFFLFDGSFSTIANDKVYNGTTNLTDLSTTDGFTIVADITGDTKGEIISTETGLTEVIFDSPVDESQVPSTITFATNVIDGGFYGYYTGDICTGTTINFKALECIGDLEQCNYFNSVSENERLKTDCGLGGSDVIGSYDSVNPTVDCTYNNEGSYSVTLFIQGETPNNLTNNGNVPIQLTVEDSANCNNQQELLNQPNQNLNESTEDSGSNLPPTDGGTSPTDPDKETDALTIAQAILENILLIIALILIIGAPLFLVVINIHHPFILFGTSLMMTIFLGLVGMISFIASVLVIIGLLVIALIVGFLFKGGNASQFGG